MDESQSSRRPAAAPGALETLDHVVIAVRALAPACETYARLLGRQPAWRGTHPQLGTENALFGLGHAYVELLAAAGEGPVARAIAERVEVEGEGLLAVAFGTDDAAACARQLRARGLAAGDPVEGFGREAVGPAERRWRTVALPGAQTRGVVLFGIEHRPPARPLAAGPPLAPEAALVTALDHVVVQTPAPDDSAALYRDLLGLRLALDRSFEAWGVRLVFFRVGGVTFELAARLDAPSDPQRPDRLWGIGYRVPDVEAARERVAAAGFEVSEVRAGRRPATRVCTVRRETHGVATLLLGPEAPG